MREQRGIRVREIADITRRSVRTLERNDLSHLSGGIVSRGLALAILVPIALVVGLSILVRMTGW